MMKPYDLSLLAIFILLSLSLYSQTPPWERISGYPQENAVNDIIRIPNSDKLIAVCDKSMVMISDDVGDSWQLILYPADLNRDFNLGQVYFINENVGFIGADEKTILKTVDGGYTWSVKYQDTQDLSFRQVYDFAFINDSVGYALANYDDAILKTSDIGETWDTVSLELDIEYIWAIEFFNELNGYILYSEEEILLTEDGGENWFIHELSEPLLLGTLYCQTSVKNDSVAFICGNDDGFRIYRSKNKGLNWEELYSDWKMAYPIDIEFFDEMNGFISQPALFDSYIVITTDGGDTWNEHITQLMVREGHHYCAYDNYRAISVGIKGSVNRSVDNAINWNKLSERVFGDEIYDICFVNDDVIFSSTTTCSESGGGVINFYLLKSIDGGNSWNIVGAGPSHFINADTGYTAYNNDIEMVIPVYLDGENVSEYIYTGINIEPEHIEFYDFYKGLIADDYGDVYFTSNGGYDWQEIGNFGYIFDIFYLSTDHTIICTDYDGFPIYQSFDGGQNWEGMEVMDFYAARSAVFLNSDTIIVAENNRIAKTINGGETWELANIQVDETQIAITDMCFPSPDVGYFVCDGTYNTMFKTEDGGLNWFPLDNEVTSTLRYVYFSDEDNGMAFGDNGVMIKTSTGGVVKTEEVEDKVSPKYFSIFPNPSTIETSINFGKNLSEDSVLEIYDSQGRLIKTYPKLTNVNSIRLSLNSFSSGIYLVSLKANSGSIQTETLIVK